MTRLSWRGTLFICLIVSIAVIAIRIPQRPRSPVVRMDGTDIETWSQDMGRGRTRYYLFKTDGTVSVYDVVGDEW